ncbi:hypothetical protein D3C73_1042150 [compost metagenome]
MIPANGRINGTYFDYRAFWSQVTVKDSKSAFFGIWLVNRMNDRVVKNFTTSDILRNCFACNGHLITENSSRFFKQFV